MIQNLAVVVFPKVWSNTTIQIAIVVSHLPSLGNNVMSWESERKKIGVTACFFILGKWRANPASK